MLSIWQENMYRFVREHHLLQVADVFLRAKLKESCELQGTENAQGQIYGYILVENRSFCMCYP